MLKFWFLALSSILFSACGGQSHKDLQSAPLVPLAVEAGVSLELAKARADAILDVNYALTFRVPADAKAPISAKEVLTFKLGPIAGDLQLDFRETKDRLESVRVNGAQVEIVHRAEHLILPARALKAGDNMIEIDFIAGDTSLNRNPDYVYTLFVPDRARTAFPVFDQPNIKATYDLVLDLPENWVALGNGLLAQSEVTEGGRRIHTFARSDRLSSYLFSFVAGEFETVTRHVNGRQMTMLHRETDSERLARNVDDIFNAHGQALAWLEDYTGIDYPFQKFDFALIPTFQYGGMEHVGAIQYRASTLLLDEDPSDPQRLNRANLIAHETAHMWFGDLVTMDWFNDVWTKEVFANFMAAKIVNPGFPEIDHDLNFMLRSYPAAYAVDRTSGANPIRQDLPNLNEAGNLYGGIIYNKAPIMMKQLELLLGEDVFRDGMRDYLATYAGRNATWPDLIAILDKRSEQDLKAWSEVWVNTAGRPHFELTETGIDLQQVDPGQAGRIWPQRISITQDGQSGFITFSGASIERLPQGGRILFNADGAGYGLFPLDLSLIAEQWASLTDLQKGAQLINLYEQMLEGHREVTPTAYFAFLQARLGEPNELLLSTLLGQLRSLYWSFLPREQSAQAISPIERDLWAYIQDTALPTSTRKIYLRTLQDIATDPALLTRLNALLDGEAGIDGISLSPRERGDLAALLAIKMPDQSAEIIDRHFAGLQSADEKRRFEFIRPALSAEAGERDTFFASLQQVENRAIESWIVDALGYLHHPQRTASSERYIQQSLEMLEEIQVTGDIFFPARWIGATLENHRSSQAATTVRRFLAERPDYNYQLKLKILQAADTLYRAEAAQAGAQDGPE